VPAGSPSVPSRVCAGAARRGRGVAGCRAKGKSGEEERRGRLTRGSHMSVKEKKKEEGTGGLGCGVSGLLGLAGLAG
jgi:hypothetical protein